MIAIALLLAVAQVPAPAPTHHWRLTAENIVNQSLKPQVGNLSGTITGPVTFGKDGVKGVVMRAGRVDSVSRHTLTPRMAFAFAASPAHAVTARRPQAMRS